MDISKNIYPAIQGGVLKGFSSSMDKETMLWIKHNTTPEQRMEWLGAAWEFAHQKKKIIKKRKSSDA